ADILALLTPVTFGGYSSHLKRMLDRLIPNILPFFDKIDGRIHHKARYERYPSMAVAGVLPEPDAEAEAIFRKLVSRNAKNHHAPVHAVEIITRDEPPEAIQQHIDDLLTNTGATA
ncbi:MAG TPA: NAD(P)H dehydrogenase, partial [Armatimonadota bacterium]|nr:NAD(P)H dehydrogenase [Armatimonadota bacterium]